MKCARTEKRAAIQLKVIRLPYYRLSMWRKNVGWQSSNLLCNRCLPNSRANSFRSAHLCVCIELAVHAAAEIEAAGAAAMAAAAMALATCTVCTSVDWQSWSSVCARNAAILIVQRPHTKPSATRTPQAPGIRPPDILVSGLWFYRDSIFYLLSIYLSSFFRQLASELAEWNSVKTGHMLGSAIWKRMSEMWGHPSPTNRES